MCVSAATDDQLTRQQAVRKQQARQKPVLFHICTSSMSKRLLVCVYHDSVLYRVQAIAQGIKS